MSASVVIRSGLIGAAVIAATIGFVNITLGAAIVGKTRRVPVELATATNTDAMKAEYRRPVFIPFPKENPYTLAKAALGKKLYFDPRPGLATAYRPMPAASAAARCMLVDISLVTVLCSSTAAAVDVTYSLTS